MSSKKVSIDATALDSLIFFTFGFTLGEPAEYVVKKVIHKAIVDATNQGAFNAQIPKEETKVKTKAQIAKDACIDGLYDDITYVVKNPGWESQDSFDDWHNKICKKIQTKYFANVQKYEEKEIFTFGNAQKILNMTLKYLYILSSIEGVKFDDDLKNLLEKIKSCAGYFHIPIDSYIIDELWSDKPSITLPIKGSQINREHSYKQPSSYVVGWSTWNEKQYNSLIKTIQFDGQSKLDWESEHWIRAAKKRRKKDKDNHDIDYKFFDDNTKK